ncbi:MAG: signal peptidase I [Bacilli bacterium]|nr:signal peptidase I [Bacilli bacterium]
MKKICRLILIIILLIILSIVIFQRVTHNKLALGNYYIFEIISGSMEPVYKAGDVIIVKKCDYESIEVGDDITYLGKENNLKDLIVTHRVIEKFEYEGKLKLKTKGINNDVEDPLINADQVYGKVVYRTIILSFLGKIMTNKTAYFVIFAVVSLIFSYEFISYFFLNDDEVEDE